MAWPQWWHIPANSAPCDLRSSTSLKELRTKGLLEAEQCTECCTPSMISTVLPMLEDTMIPCRRAQDRGVCSACAVHMRLLRMRDVCGAGAGHVRGVCGTCAGHGTYTGQGTSEAEAGVMISVQALLKLRGSHPHAANHWWC